MLNFDLRKLSIVDVILETQSLWCKTLLFPEIVTWSCHLTLLAIPTTEDKKKRAMLRKKIL